MTETNSAAESGEVDQGRHSTNGLAIGVEYDGYSAKEVFAQACGYTYNDLILLPGHIDFPTDKVSLTSKFSRNISLKTPFVSSPMDTVTEHQMAIGMALQGGIGVIHYNMPVDQQAQEVARVKRYENGRITDPSTLSPSDTINDVDEIKFKFGFTGVPITEDGKMGSKLLGIVTNRDIDFLEDRDLTLEKVMTPLEKLVTAPEDSTLNEANMILIKVQEGEIAHRERKGGTSRPHEPPRPVDEPRLPERDQRPEEAVACGRGNRYPPGRPGTCQGPGGPRSGRHRG
eukprot:TRINITY_DN972_c0_g1_i1.p1 TRINITY_DN972_c0_g1~~TRINITY_DN972_c0_g1_i1.p1  ORF type:complete len:286 (-),score=37.73 TRINITY_DN972_c0_g1_i1:255-1112(-)